MKVCIVTDASEHVVKLFRDCKAAQEWCRIMVPDCWFEQGHGVRPTWMAYGPENLCYFLIREWPAAFGEKFYYKCYPEHTEAMRKAADELEARRAECERLAAESAAGCAVCIHWSGSVCDKNCALHGGMCASLETPFCSPRVAELEAENARLREALEPIAFAARNRCGPSLHKADYDRAARAFWGDAE